MSKAAGGGVGLPPRAAKWPHARRRHLRELRPSPGGGSRHPRTHPVPYHLPPLRAEPAGYGDRCRHPQCRGGGGGGIGEALDPPQSDRPARETQGDLLAAALQQGQAHLLALKVQPQLMGQGEHPPRASSLPEPGPAVGVEAGALDAAVFGRPLLHRGRAALPGAESAGGGRRSRKVGHGGILETAQASLSMVTSTIKIGSFVAPSAGSELCPQSPSGLWTTSPSGVSWGAAPDPPGPRAACPS